MKLTPRPAFRIATPSDLGLWIRHARRAQGLSTQAAADLCNVSPRFLSSVERGKSTAQVGKVLGLMQALGLVVSVRSRGDRGSDTQP